MAGVSILLGQLLKMAAFMAVGFALYRTKTVSQSESKAISQLLLYAVIPCVILRSYLGLARERLPEVIISLILGAVVLIAAIILARLLFRRRREDQFGAAFSNAGFLGIPLISGTLGVECVFYISGMVALLNILQWTYGQRLLSKEKTPFRLVQLIKNPLVISYLIGLVCFLTQIQLPTPVEDCLDALAACNAPLAMIVLGISLGAPPGGNCLPR